MPLLAIGIGAMAAGTAMEVAGGQKSQNAINRVRSQELAQQRNFQNEASGVFQNSVDNNSAPKANADLASGAAARTAIASALKMGAPSTTLPSNQTDYQVQGNPQEAAAGRVNTAGNAWSNLVGGATARLGGYGDMATKQNIDNEQAAGRLGVIGNKARGTANLLPVELEVAGHKGDSLSGWGKIVSALGSVASMGAAAGFGAGAAAPAATGTWDATQDAWTIGQGAAMTPGVAQSAWAQALNMGPVPVGGP